jgi:hypothetical protein
MNMRSLPSFVQCTRNSVRIQVSSASRRFSSFADALTSQRAGRMYDRESCAIPGTIGISPSVLESQFASFCLNGNTPVGQTARLWLNLHSFASADLRKSQEMCQKVMNMQECQKEKVSFPSLQVVLEKTWPFQFLTVPFSTFPTGKRWKSNPPIALRKPHNHTVFSLRTC